MSNTNSVNVGIKSSVSLLAFAREHGRMQVGQFANKETGETFKSCVFTKDDGSRCFVSFSRNLGELTPAEIAARKNDLQVCELNTGSYKLCSNGADAWQDVDLL